MADQLKYELAVLAGQKGWLDAQRGKPAPRVDVAPPPEPLPEPVPEPPVGLWQRLKGKMGR